MPPTGIRTARVVALALLLGVFLTAQPMVMNAVSGRHQTLGDVVSELSFWLVWAAFTPVVLRAAARWPLDAPHVPRRLLTHVALSLLLAPVPASIYLAREPLWQWLTGEITVAQLPA